MATLYIVGNGFDMHHRLPTSYTGFRKFAEYSSFSNAFERYFEYENLDDLWGDLEESLSQFSVDVLVDHKVDYFDNDPHENQFEFEVENEVDNLTKGLVEILSEYLNHAENSFIERHELLDINRSCRFLSFNYTSTLERIYHVPKSNICHIHGIT